jgi:phage/plasmid-associated DNA primase
VASSTLKNPTELLADADTLAPSYEYRYYNNRLYAPVDYLEGDQGFIPPIERRCWVPLSTTDIQITARELFQTAFRNDKQLWEFIFMLQQSAQAAHPVGDVQPWLLIKTAGGLKVLREDGQLYDPDGEFVPNMLAPVLNEDKADKAELMKIITEWLGGYEEETMSLLHHLATTLAPHWPTGKYMLLIGDGANGKSLLMTMLQKLFGSHNCSGVARQEISSGSTAVFDVNGKLLNLVFDGPAEFVKDSGREKTLITGESLWVRRLYANEQSEVKTNALFIEGLNQEPRSKDKSSALQRRLVRYRFPNRYIQDDVFFARMLSDQMLGALLSLLMDNYVLPENKAIMLAPTQRSRELQREHMEDNSLAVQFLVHLEETDPAGAVVRVVDEPFDTLVQMFKSWRIKVDDLTVYDKSTVFSMFNPVLHTVRKSARGPGQSVVKVRVITGVKPDMLELLESLKEDINAITVVDDRQV